MATDNFPQTILEATRYFSNPDVALATAVALRWKGGPVACPTCGCTDVHFIATRRIWRCKNEHPQRQFSVKVGTIMEDSPIPLDKWMVAIWLLSNCKNGISSYEIGRDLGVTQKTGWFLMHRIRLAMQAGSFDKLCGEVEADETYIGGKARNRHKAKRERIHVTRGRSIAGKVAVFGVLDRQGKNGHSEVRTEVLDSLKKRTVQGYVRNHVESGATIYTDAFSPTPACRPTTCTASSTTPRRTSMAAFTPTGWRTSGRF